MFCVTYVTVNIQNVLLWLQCRRGDEMRNWLMASSISLCFTPTHTSIRCRFKQFTSCAFSGRLDAHIIL